jgi:hypothetical protein
MARTAHSPIGTTKVLGYVRVSTEEQVERGVSLDAQRAKLEAYATLYDLVLSQDDFFCSNRRPKKLLVWDIQQKSYATK